MTRKIVACPSPRLGYQTVPNSIWNDEKLIRDFLPMLLYFASHAPFFRHYREATMDALGWGKHRYDTARAYLVEHKYLELIDMRRDDGTVAYQCAKVNWSPKFNVIDNRFAQADSRLSGTCKTGRLRNLSEKKAPNSDVIDICDDFSDLPSRKNG